MSPMIFMLLRKLNDSSEDVFTNMEFQVLFFTAVQLFPFTHINILNKFKNSMGELNCLPLSLAH